MRNSPNGHTVPTSNEMAAHEIDPWPARRAAAALSRIGSPLHATAAAPLWRALRDEGALWLLTPAERGGTMTRGGA
jgi:hypothetical protein